MKQKKKQQAFTIQLLSRRLSKNRLSFCFSISKTSLKLVFFSFALISLLCFLVKFYLFFFVFYFWAKEEEFFCSGVLKFKSQNGPNSIYATDCFALYIYKYICFVLNALLCEVLGRQLIHKNMLVCLFVCQRITVVAAA